MTYPLSLCLLPRVCRAGLLRADDADDNTARTTMPPSIGAMTTSYPSVAICMSAYNEERVIAAKLDSLLAMAAAYPGRVRIEVYDDGSRDRTPDILRSYADRANVVFASDRRGKTWGMRQLVEASASDLLLFTDANVVAGADSLDRLAACFADPHVGLASARLRYANPGESATSRSGAAYWEVEEAIKRIESRTIGLVGVDGAMFMIRRSLYRPPPAHLIDDLYVSLAVLIAGARIVTVPGLTVSERSAVLPREEFSRKRRIACQAWNVHRALWGELRRMPGERLYGYISHRVLKWWTPVLVLLAAVQWLVLSGLWFGFGRSLAVVFGLAGCIWLGDVVGVITASLMVALVYNLAGVGVGVFQSMFTGETYTIWSPAGSVREQTGARLT